MPIDTICAHSSSTCQLDSIYAPPGNRLFSDVGICEDEDFFFKFYVRRGIVDGNEGIAVLIWMVTVGIHLKTIFCTIGRTGLYSTS